MLKMWAEEKAGFQSLSGRLPFWNSHVSPSCKQDNNEGFMYAYSLRCRLFCTTHTLRYYYYYYYYLIELQIGFFPGAVVLQ
jgi:hypothetical protein